MIKKKLGIAGLGTVAQGVLEILRDNGAIIAARTGFELEVARVASRTPRSDIDLGGAAFSTDLDDLIADAEVDIVLELIGGETVARDFIEAALTAGKPVVTANKAVIASHGNLLLSRNTSAPLRFEAAVAGAIPIIQAIQSGLVANRFEHVVGIINGTCNYILTAMQEQGASFTDALARAQELGYAEADPTFDVGGIDAAHKLAILLALAFDVPFSFDDIAIDGITAITPEDIQYAAELGYRIKHLGIARQTDAGLEARVHPTLVPEQQLLASVNGVLNAVLVKTDAAGDTMFSGPGAGGLATASAVLSDVLAVAGAPVERAERRAQDLKILPVADTVSAHYLRIPALDEPGVFAQVANTLSRYGISIEAAIQKEPHGTAEQPTVVAIVILTQVTREGDMAAAVAELNELPQVAGEIARIRVESLG